MTVLERHTFDTAAFLTTAGLGRRIVELEPRQAFFSQGDPADSVFYLQRGRAKVSVVSTAGKEATITLVSAGEFVGEGALAGVPGLRLSTATAITYCSALKIGREEMARAMHAEPEFSDLFFKYLLARSMRTQADLVDQLFNSSEKRLARILLLMAEFAKPGEAIIPDVLAHMPRAWLAVPLTHLGRLLGFILLTEPRAAIHLNWENYELLRIASRQVASYLAEEQAARALVEARQLQAYSQRFAFVVHDIKNVVSQLSLVLSNGESHADDPEFQRDVLETVRHSVFSMNKMLAQLRANREAEAAESVVPAVVAEELLQAWRPKKLVDIHFHTDGQTARVRIGRDQLDSALRHLLDNAVEI